MIQADQRTLRHADVICDHLAFGDQHEIDVLIEAVAEGLVVSLTLGDDQIGVMIDFLKSRAGVFDHGALGNIAVADDGGVLIHADFIGVLFGGVVDHGSTADTEVDS